MVAAPVDGCGSPERATPVPQGLASAARQAPTPPPLMDLSRSHWLRPTAVYARKSESGRDLPDGRFVADALGSRAAAHDKRSRRQSPLDGGSPGFNRSPGTGDLHGNRVVRGRRVLE